MLLQVLMLSYTRSCLYVVELIVYGMVGSGAMGASNQLEMVYGEDLTPSSTLRTLYV